MWQHPIPTGCAHHASQLVELPFTLRPGRVSRLVSFLGLQEARSVSFALDFAPTKFLVKCFRLNAISTCQPLVKLVTFFQSKLEVGIFHLKKTLKPNVVCSFQVEDLLR